MSPSVTRCGNLAPLGTFWGPCGPFSWDLSTVLRFGAKFLLPGCNFFLEPIYCWTLFVDNWALFHSNHLVTLLATSKKILGHVPGVSYHANHEDLQACPALDWPPVHRLHPQEQLQGARLAHALPRHGCPHLLQPLLLRWEGGTGFCLLQHSGLVLVGLFRALVKHRQLFCSLTFYGYHLENFKHMFKAPDKHRQQWRAGLGTWLRSLGS